MTKPLTQFELELLIPLMHDMLSHAGSGEWEALSRLDKERMSILKGSSTMSQAEQTATKKNPLYTGLINTVAQLDKDIIEAVVSAREELVSESQGHRNQIKAKQNYAKASSLISPALR